MNERNLFRGKTIEGIRPHFVTGHYVSVPRPMIVSDKPKIGGGWDFDDVDPATVGQCTGLRDKNGKPIFDGDIVQVDCYDYNEPSNSYFGIVKMSEFGFGLQQPTDDGYFEWGYLCDMKGSYITHYEVVGNEYDNPELLAAHA